MATDTTSTHPPPGRAPAQIKPGQTVTTPGSYRYSRTLQIGMNGWVDVVAGPGV